jgi:hypothetical protein
MPADAIQRSSQTPRAVPAHSAGNDGASATRSVGRLEAHDLRRIRHVPRTTERPSGVTDALYAPRAEHPMASVSVSV